MFVDWINANATDSVAQHYSPARQDKLPNYKQDNYASHVSM